MKKIVIVGLILLSIFWILVLGLCIFNTKNLEFQNDVELAIYINDEESLTIPLKDSGYIFDSEKSSCTNNANISWDNESWSPVVKNMSEYKTRCTLSFRDYYQLTVLDDNDTQVYQIPLSDSSTSIQANTNHTLLTCNQGVELTNSNEDIVVNNIQSDVSCKYYDSSVDAINSLDDSKNYFIYLKDENIDSELTINEGKSLTMDLNGYNLVSTAPLYNYAKLNVVSSSSLAKLTVNHIDGAIRIYGDSSLLLENVELYSLHSTLHAFDSSSLSIYNSNIFSDQGDASAIWLHGGKTTTEIYDSYIKGPYGIGGEGGNILVDSSKLEGISNTGLQVNINFDADIILQNDCDIFGALYGILLFSGSLTLNGNESVYPIIRGAAYEGIRLINDENAILFNYYYGDIYGSLAPTINGKITLLDGKTMVSVEEDGVIHTYLQ